LNAGFAPSWKIGISYVYSIQRMNLGKISHHIAAFAPVKYTGNRVGLYTRKRIAFQKNQNKLTPK
jgi:hypothetical protein